MIHISAQNEFVRKNLQQLGNWLGYSEVEKFVDELASNIELKTSIEAAVKDVDFFLTKKWDGVLRFGLYRAAQYALVRVIGASTFVETGVLHGLTSAFVLNALSQNDSGRLISIDLPSTFEGGVANRDGFEDTLPPGLPPGWVVSDDLRKFWSLRIGSSRELLPTVCREAGSIDIFLHDSEHTLSTMTFEFETVWPYIRNDGLLIADNIDCNTSFFDFCRRVNRVPYIAPADPDHIKPPASGIRFGVIKK